jgi:hypothetical protein
MIPEPLTTLLIVVLFPLGFFALGAIVLGLLIGFLSFGPLGMAAFGLALLPYALLVVGFVALVVQLVGRVRVRSERRSTRVMRSLLVPAIALLSGCLLITIIPTERAAELLGQRAQCGDPHDRVDVPSPDGRYLASAITWFCGGAAGSIGGSITLGPINDHVGFQTDQIVYIEERATGIDLSWQDYQLIVDMHRRPAFEIPRRLDPDWRDVRVLYLGAL